MSAPDFGRFTPLIKPLTVDARGRVTLSSAFVTKGATYRAAVDPEGRILLTPEESEASRG